MQQLIRDIEEGRMRVLVDGDEEGDHRALERAVRGSRTLLAVEISMPNALIASCFARSTSLTSIAINCEMIDWMWAQQNPDAAEGLGVLMRAALPALQELVLHGFDLTARSTVSGMRRLMRGGLLTIRISECWINARFVNRLCDAVGEASNRLRFLEMENCTRRFEDEDVHLVNDLSSGGGGKRRRRIEIEDSLGRLLQRKLSEALMGHPFMETLKVRGMNLSELSGITVAAATCPMLRSLDVGENRSGDALAIRNLLRTSTKLDKLNASSAYFSRSEIEGICRTVVRRRRIKSITMNAGSDAGYEALETLLQSDMLEMIEIEAKNITDFYSAELLPVLARHPSLRHLRIVNHSMTDYGALRMANAFMRAPCMQIVELYGPHMRQDGHVEMHLFPERRRIIDRVIALLSATGTSSAARFVTADGDHAMLTRVMRMAEVRRF